MGPNAREEQAYTPGVTFAAMEPCRAWLGGRGYAPENEADAPLDEPEEEADAPGVTRAAMELCSAWLRDRGDEPDDEADAPVYEPEGEQSR